MIRQKIIIVGFFVVSFLIMANPGLVRAESFADVSGKFIQGLADRAIAELTVDGLSVKERRERFRIILNKEFAVKTIGRWVLGRYWRKASKAQQKEYLRLFENLLVVTYADRFADYKGEKLRVLKSVAKGKNDIIVFTQIKKPNETKPAEIQWRVRSKKGKPLIVDVMVVGISMGQSQRSEFASVIRKNGGDIGLFLKEMRNQRKISMVSAAVSDK